MLQRKTNKYKKIKYLKNCMYIVSFFSLLLDIFNLNIATLYNIFNVLKNSSHKYIN